MSEQDAAMSLVFHEIDGAVARIILNRPERLNALSLELRQTLDKSLSEVLAARDVRVVVIKSRGRAFSAGGDLDSLPKEPMVWRERLRLAQDHHSKMMRSDKVFVAAVQGAAAGGGASLALAADIMVMSEDAKLVVPFSKLGLVPDGGAAYMLSKKLGPAMATDLLLTGTGISAAEAKAVNLTRRVVPLVELEAATDALVDALLAIPEGSLALTKNLLRASWCGDLQASFDHEVDSMALAASLPGHQAALKAALNRPEKR